MASELKSKKRKSAAPAESTEPKKTKQVKAEAPVKKRKAAEESATIVPTKKAKAETAPAKKSTKSKKSSAPEINESETIDVTTKSNGENESAVKVTTKKTQKKGKVNGADIVEETVQVVEEPVVEEDSEGSSDEEIDDQTVALLTGFESDNDEKDADADDGFEQGQKVPKLSKNLTKKANAANQSQDDGPGVLYIGRIPHGFYESEMRQYFSQFGDISRLRLSRNPKTGRSKHFAFIEFKSAEVAEITAKAMDNYLLFGHILKVKVVPKEQVHPELWKGSNKRFKKVPWNKFEGRRLEAGKTEAAWEEQIERENERRAAKAEKLKALGYEFEAPKIKSAKGMPKTARKALTAKTAEEAPKAIEAAPAAVAEKESKPKKGKKTAEVETTEPVVESAPEPSLEKGKKAKKAKATAPAEEEAIITAETAEPAPSKKSKKTKTPAVETDSIEPKETVKKSKGKAAKAATEKSDAVEVEQPRRRSKRNVA